MFSSRLPAQLAINRLTEALRARRAARRPIIDLTESNPTRAGFDYPPDLLVPLADVRGLRYDPTPCGSLAARTAVAREYERQGLSVAPGRIVLTASTSDAYSLLFRLLANAGDEVLVPRPSYPLFDHLTRLDLVTSKPYDLDYHGAWSVNLASVDRALSAATRAVLVVSPNNPTGSFISRDELDALATRCAAREAAIIADEVFADYELEEGGVGRAGRVAARNDVLSFSLGGLSKSVGLPQVKLGWIALGGPDHLVAPALERLELICDTYLVVSTPAQIAAAGLLERGAVVRTQIAARVAANYRQLRSMVATAPACGVLRSDGGWYAVLQVPSLASEEDLVVDLLASEGVLIHPGYFFDFPRESFLIASLLTPSSAFADGITRVLRRFIAS